MPQQPGNLVAGYLLPRFSESIYKCSINKLRWPLLNDQINVKRGKLLSVNVDKQDPVEWGQFLSFWASFWAPFKMICSSRQVLLRRFTRASSLTQESHTSLSCVDGKLTPTAEICATQWTSPPPLTKLISIHYCCCTADQKINKPPPVWIFLLEQHEYTSRSIWFHQ